MLLDSLGCVWFYVCTPRYLGSPFLMHLNGERKKVFRCVNQRSECKHSLDFCWMNVFNPTSALCWVNVHCKSWSWLGEGTGHLVTKQTLGCLCLQWESKRGNLSLRYGWMFPAAIANSCMETIMDDWNYPNWNSEGSCVCLVGSWYCWIMDDSILFCLKN